ncbi:TetR/AcrR family transcriptional regulator [Nocardiopsis sp. MG754419]|uniref:TetR/AcrR family transcriptional regulator n=1 Tax=Nocardiopsis sp. MG754419 TaxID=2259865 RepID=UPI001BA730E2|nr:TetR/AcrR family transcriptional regulator [Nocardiopsis sp. MG754419]MBR8744751.1 TetR/AcrR family transcriptional regulator [Nocardiopsis sp. MG754419]
MSTHFPAHATSEAPPVTPMGLRERKVRQTRDALVDAALEAFSERGFADVTLDELCAAVQVSRRTFFRRFRNKEDVVLAPMDDLWARFLECLERAPLTESSLVGLLGRVLVDAITGMPEGWERRMSAATRLSDATPSIRAESLAVCERTRTAAMAVLERRVQVETVDPVDLSLSVRMLVAAHQTAVDLWSEDGDRADAPGLAERTAHVLSVLPHSVAATVAPR